MRRKRFNRPSTTSFLTLDAQAMTEMAASDYVFVQPLHQVRSEDQLDPFFLCEITTEGLRLCPHCEKDIDKGPTDGI